MALTFNNLDAIMVAAVQAVPSLASEKNAALTTVAKNIAQSRAIFLTGSEAIRTSAAFLHAGN
ncbi:hypothetical protein HK405_013192, partial [Cladochytrium tenue]